MKASTIYLKEIRLAQRLAAFADRHPKMIAAAEVVVGLATSFYIFMYY